MNIISEFKRKIKTLRFFIKNGITKPVKLGDKILLLATAPCANYFFKYKSVREQFKDYDLAIINFMLLYSEKEVFELKPKYIILFDPIFYIDGLKGDIIDFDAKKTMKIILEKIDWECYIVTTTLADFGLENEFIKYIRLSFISSNYINILHFFFKKNWLNMGINNVIHGALYFSITFGYKKVAMLGCPYRHLDFHMESDGMHIKEHMHYYDKEPCKVFLSNEQLLKRKSSFTMSLYKRAFISSKIFWNIRNYANKQNVEIINYSEESEIDVFLTRQLVIEKEY